MTQKKYFSICLLLITLVFQVSCGKESKSDNAVAIIYPTKGYRTSGLLRLKQGKFGLRITGRIRGLSRGKHGFHIHEYGDCSGKSGKTAGGHYNPEAVSHAGPKSKKKHVGDMGNIEADARGLAEIDRLYTNAKLSGETSVIGRAIVVHLNEDDLVSQPTGAAGPRVGCGVIGIAKD